MSIDSMQVYRGMDIGTAKPSAAERAEVPHHLLDLVDPTHDFTVAEFRSAYAAAIDRSVPRSSGAARRRHRPLPPGGHRRLRPAGGVARRSGPTWNPRPERARCCSSGCDDARSGGRRQDGADQSAAGRAGARGHRRLAAVPSARSAPASTATRRPSRAVGSAVAAGGARRADRGPCPRDDRRRSSSPRSRRSASRGFSRTAAQALGYKEILDALAGRISSG